MKIYTEPHNTNSQISTFKRFSWKLFLAVLATGSLFLLTSCSKIQKDNLTTDSILSFFSQMDTLETPSPSDQELDPSSQNPADLVWGNQTDSFFLPTPDPWNGRGRVTILVMGLDYADWDPERAGPPRSDSMILLTIDPTSHTAGMLSIPRDLWVTIPGIQGEHKINTAFHFGEYYNLPGGGPGLAMRTVEHLIEVPINFYAVIDFYTFEDLIDALGGIEIDVPYEIQVDPIGPANSAVLMPGLQLLDGSTTLAYARNRYTAGGDLDRIRRQQQVIIAMREQFFSLQSLPKLIYKAPGLYNQLRTGVQTNMTIAQAIKLAWLVGKVQTQDIKRAAVGTGDVIYDVSVDDQAILRPIMERIHALRDEIFTGLTAEELVAAENARITLINESGDARLGEVTAQYLEALGFNIMDSIQGDEVRKLTRLVDLADNPSTLRKLIELMQVQPSEIYIQYELNANTDMLIYLGTDWAADNSLGD